MPTKKFKKKYIQMFLLKLVVYLLLLTRQKILF